MGQSMFAEVKRTAPLTEDERMAIQSIVNKFDMSHMAETWDPANGVGENWSAFIWDEPGDGVVLEGSTRLPDVSVNRMIDAVDHFGIMLGRIRLEVLPEAEWSVWVESSELGWFPDEDQPKFFFSR